MERRSFLKKTVVMAAAGVLNTRLVFAEKLESDPFKAGSLDEVLALLNASGSKVSDKIKLKAPEIAENGAVVPVSVVSDIEGTTEIIVIIVENPTPLAAKFLFSEGVIPSVKSRFKMGKTTDVIALAKSGDEFYMAKTNVKVTKGGCGG